MISYPLISVLLPIYNAEQFLTKCLNSIISQTYTNIEIICIDDGSTDNSLQILKNFANNDKRIIVHTRTNKGDHITRMELLQKVKGKYFIFIDNDDYIEQNTIETLYNTMNTQNVDMVECNVNHIRLGNRNTNYAIKHFGKFKNFEYINYYSYPLWNKLFKTEIVKNFKITFPNNPNITCVFDKWFNFEYICCCKNIYAIPEKLYNYLIHNSSTLSNMDYKKNISDFYSLNETYNFLKNNNLFKTYQNIFFKKLIKYSSKITKKDIYFQEAKKEILTLEKKLKNDFPLSFYLYKLKQIFNFKNILSIKKSLDGKSKIITLFGIKFIKGIK